MNIDPNEVLITGSWKLQDGHIVEDEICLRIQQLIEKDFQQVAVSQDGWEKLYRNRTEERYWELYYPQSDMHGGGPPALRVISFERAKCKYNVD